MQSNNILVISNNKEIGATISDKIKLLRECDVIKVVSYIEAISELNTKQPSVILLHCANYDSVNIVKEIRKLKSLDKVPVIFITDTFIEDLLLFAFDNGIDDFFFLSDPDSIILTRIFLTIQKSVLYKQIENDKDILTAANIIDKETGLYTKEHVSALYPQLFKRYCDENVENAVFMCLKITFSDTSKTSFKKTAKKVKSILRGNDEAAFAKNHLLYIILNNAGLKGAQVVFSKIKNSLGNTASCYAACAEINAEFEKLEHVLLNTLNQQVNDKEDFNYIKNINISQRKTTGEEKTGILSDPNARKNYFDSLDEIIAPVFYQVQTSASSILPEADITFDVSENESVFSIKQNEITTNVIITFPSFVKLVIDIKHKEKNSTPMVRRLTYTVEEFSEEKLSSILNDVVKEFSAKLNLNKIYNSD